MQRIGGWCWGLVGCTCSCPTPTTLAPPEQRKHKEALLAYLRSAPIIATHDQGFTCRFASCAHEHIQGVASVGDDAWRWSQVLTHMVEVHDLAIPEAMFAHLQARGFVVPDVAGTTPVQKDAWLAFANAHGARPLTDVTREYSEMLYWNWRWLDPHWKRQRRPVGYWAKWENENIPWLPWPQDLVDVDWDPPDRDLIVGYLKAGVPAIHWDGYSTCRFAGCESGGSRCLYDGVFVWPEDYWHYVAVHRVRPPQPFIDHIRARDHVVASVVAGGLEEESLAID